MKVPPATPPPRSPIRNTFLLLEIPLGVVPCPTAAVRNTTIACPDGGDGAVRLSAVTLAPGNYVYNVSCGCAAPDHCLVAITWPGRSTRNIHIGSLTQVSQIVPCLVLGLSLGDIISVSDIFITHFCMHLPRYYSLTKSPLLLPPFGLRRFAVGSKVIASDRT
jgi:hypothetical protein